MHWTVLILSILILRSSNPGGFIVWCVIGLSIGLYLFFQGFRLLKKRQIILNTPLSKIRSASLGMVELSGLATGPYTMPAPITARPSYFYRTLIWEWKQSGKNKRWVQVAAECMHLPFFLDDNTGKILIDPRGAELDLHRDFQQEFCDSFFTTKEEVPPNVRALLSRHGIATANKIRVEEFCIKPKNALFLLGTLAENRGTAVSAQPIADEQHHTLLSVGPVFPNPLQSLGTTALAFAASVGKDSSFEERSVSERLMGALSHDSSMFSNSAVDKAILEEEYGRAAASRVIKPSPQAAPNKFADLTQQQRVAAALTKAGICAPAAWAAARVTNSTGPADGGPLPSNDPGSLDGFDSHPAVVVMKGKNNPMFLISWRSQREVARSLGWKCSLMIWGGPLLALLSLYGLLTMAHLI